MSAPFLSTLPRPVVFAAYGGIAALLVALTAGELVWWAFKPPPEAVAESEPKPHTAPPAAQGQRLALTVSPKVLIYPGGTNTISVRVARDKFDGPVAVRLDL